MPHLGSAHRVVVLVPEQVVAFDLALVTETFGLARLEDGRPAYEVEVCGEGVVETRGFRIEPGSDLTALERADTIVLPGSADAAARLSDACRSSIVAAAARGTRVVSICSGAFLLAQTGLLEGRRVTTHWRAALDLARTYPGIEVDPNVLYVDTGAVLTSAGGAAGLDLCLHIIRRDHGAAVAANVARWSVMPLERSGGQAQFIRHEPPAPEGSSLSDLLQWIEAHLDQDLSVPALARRAGMSTRGLARHFRVQTSMSPATWVATARVRRAQHLLETSDVAIERVGEAVGFRTPSTFRDQFRRLVGTSPREYRSAFRGRRDPDQR